MAVVQHDLSFGGVWIIEQKNLVEQISLVEDKEGWSFTFSPNTSPVQIEERCQEFERIASKCWEVMQRRASRQA